MERSPRDASKGQAAMVQAEGRRLICQALSAGCLLRRRPRVARGCLWRTKPRPAALSGISSRVRERLLPTSAYWARKASPPLCQRHIEKTTASRPALTRSCAPTTTNDGSWPNASRPGRKAQFRWDSELQPLDRAPHFERVRFAFEAPRLDVAIAGHHPRDYDRFRSDPPIPRGDSSSALSNYGTPRTAAWSRPRSIGAHCF